MQKCKIDRDTCCGYNKKTKTCHSIENCKYKISIYEEDKKVIESIKNIMEYCGGRKIECEDCILGPKSGNFCNEYLNRTPEDWDLRIIK